MRSENHGRRGFPAALDGRVSPTELALFALASLVLLAGSASHFDLMERTYHFARRYEAFELDEIIGALLLLPWLTTVFLIIRGKRYRTAAARTQHLAGAILDAAPHAVTVSDASGSLIYLNPAGRKLMGIGPKQDLASLHILDLYAETHRDETVPEALAQVEENGVWSGYLNRVTSDGREFPTADVLIAHKDAAGSLQHISSISRDLSGRVALEQRLQHKHKLEAVGQLAGGIAHQYNNLLMVLAGHTRRAMKLTRNVPAAEAPLHDMLRTVDIAAEMTRDLLLFTRRQPLQKRTVRIARALGDVQKLLEPLLDERFALAVKIDDTNACAETDAGELVQAMMNLALNARDAMLSGGTIEIRLESTVLEERTSVGPANELPAGQYVRLSVKDTGNGIDDNTRKQLFEPFFTTKEAGHGTGLGLAVVQGFAEASGGAVDVESAPGDGSTFHIYLPKTDRQPLATPDPKDGDIAGKGETILLVEDNNELREIIAEMLDELGYHVLAAADGFDAVEIEQDYEHDIDLLLTDVVMPDISGPEVDRIIRRQRSNIKTLFISGYPGGQAGGFVEPLPDGARLLRKPIDPTDLARAIRTTLQEPNGTASEVSHGEAYAPAGAERTQGTGGRGQLRGIEPVA